MTELSPLRVTELSPLGFCRTSQEEVGVSNSWHTATNHSDGHLFPTDAPVWPGVPRLPVLAIVLCEEACGVFCCIARCLSHTPLRDVYTWLFQRVSYFLQDYVSWWAEQPDHICWLPLRLCRVRCPTQ